MAVQTEIPKVEETPKVEGVDLLQQLRDELKLQIHLGTTEARAEWEVLEQKWLGLEARMQDLGNASATAVRDFEKKSATTFHNLGTASMMTLKEVEAAAELLVGELLVGYKRLRKALPF
jgi:hypothetical protein